MAFYQTRPPPGPPPMGPGYAYYHNQPGIMDRVFGTDRMEPPRGRPRSPPPGLDYDRRRLPSPPRERDLSPRRMSPPPPRAYDDMYRQREVLSPRSIDGRIERMNDNRGWIDVNDEPPPLPRPRAYDDMYIPRPQYEPRPQPGPRPKGYKFGSPEHVQSIQHKVKDFDDNRPVYFKNKKDKFGYFERNPEDKGFERLGDKRFERRFDDRIDRYHDERFGRGSPFGRRFEDRPGPGYMGDYNRGFDDRRRFSNGYDRPSSPYDRYGPPADDRYRAPTPPPVDEYDHGGEYDAKRIAPDLRDDPEAGKRKKDYFAESNVGGRKKQDDENPYHQVLYNIKLCLLCF